MVERIKPVQKELYTLEEFLSDRLKRYIKDMASLKRSNLYSTVISEVEKALIKIVLETMEGNQLRTAKALGISRTTLREKIKEYGLGDSTSQNLRRSRRQKR